MVFILPQAALRLKFPFTKHTYLSQACTHSYQGVHQHQHIDNGVHIQFFLDNEFTKYCYPSSS